jgi:hypothetical protein
MRYDHKRLIFNENNAEESYHKYRDNEGEKHYEREFADGYVEFIIYVEVLRVAEGRYHTAEVCRDILHDKRERHIFLLAGAVEGEEAEGQKCYERHIICYEHRADEGDVDKRDNAKARIFTELYDLTRKYREKADVAESANHRKHGKKASERFEIEISEVGGVGRHDERSYHRGGYRYEKHGIVLCKIGDRAEESFF